MLRIKKLIAVSQRIDLITSVSEIRDSLDQRLSEWIISAGYNIVPIPNTLLTTNRLNSDGLLDWLYCLSPNGLILSGGNDIGAFTRRDLTEAKLLSWAAEKKIPVLGICRGMQMMAVWSGVSLVKSTGHVGVRHDLIIENNTDNWPKNVNSYHNWNIAKCPDNFKVMLRSLDGSIEAIKHDKLPWEGWMWHPERELVYSDNDVYRLKKLFNES